MNSVRLKTLIAESGEPRGLLSSDNIEQLDEENRIVTIYDYGYGVIGYHRVDVNRRLVFPKSISIKHLQKRVIGG